MSEDQLKQKKLEELKEQMKQRQENEQKEVDMDNQVNLMLKQTLSEEARQRLNNVKLVNKELYMRAFQAIMGLQQQGYLKEKLNEAQVKEILMKLKNDREINIKRM